MAVPHVTAGETALASEQNALIDQCNANEERSLASKVVTDAASFGGDLGLYGDQASTTHRYGIDHIEVLSNGFQTMAATIVMRDATVSELRLAVGTAASTDGTFKIAVYTGADTRNLDIAVPQFNADTAISSAGLVTIALPSSMSFTAGEAVALGILAEGYTTEPDLGSTPVLPNFSGVINQVPYSVYANNPGGSFGSTADMGSTFWTPSNQIYWFALA